MMFFKFVLIFVIMTIQNSNSVSFPELPELPEILRDCKDIECIMKWFREQKEISATIKPSGEIKLLLNT